MRPYVLLALGVLLVTSGASAAELLTVDHPSYAVDPPQREPVQVYQNYDITTIGDTQVACGVAGSYTTQNWFLRRFYLHEDHGLDPGIIVQSIDFGVSFLTGDMTVDIVVFQIPNGSEFRFDNMTEITRESVDLTPNDVGFLVNVPLSAEMYDGIGQDLVVAIEAPSGEPNLVSFYPAANDAGAFQDAYIAAANCDVPEPMAVSDIGFPDSQTIFVVNGESGIGGPPPPPVATTPTTWGAVRGLFR